MVRRQCRQAAVTRHNIRVTSSSGLQVGNGEFAITAGISGLISFSSNPILAHWAWHSDPLLSGQTTDDFQWTIHRRYDGCEKPYPWQNGPEIGKWMITNLHKASLRLLGLVLVRDDGSTARLGLYGMLPGDGVNLETMQRTFDKVHHLWPKYKWGWDYAMVAMCAARLGKRETAVDVLLHPDFHFSISGAGYFPGRGGLLYAVAMMAAGWDGCPEGNAPGFPDDGSWNLQWEGLKPALGLEDSF